MSMSGGMTRTNVTTASGYLALLQEDNVSLRHRALQKLLACVDTLWHEVAEALPDLEAMAEDGDLPQDVRQIAAAVASRVFFHLEEPTQALRLALEAGPQHFDPMQANVSPYVERLVAAALDAYVDARKRLLLQEDATQPEGDEQLIGVEQLKGMVDRLLEASCAQGRYDHAMGVALEAMEADKVREILQASPTQELIKYTMESATLHSTKAFRLQVLAVCAECLAQDLKANAYEYVLVQQMLGQAEPVSKVLTDLLNGASDDEQLLGLQICFDLMDSGDQAFVKSVSKSLFSAESGDESNLPTVWQQAKRVLVGGFSSELALSFLHKQSKADRLIMENLKKALEERSSGSRSSILHNAAVMTHSYLYAGTTNDSFLRDFLDWMKKASNWYV